MNNLQIFSNSDFGSIRTVTIEDNPWFCGRDVAIALGYAIPQKAICDHCRPGGVLKRNTPTTGGVQNMTYISEPNLYRLIIHSKLPSAERFECWVFEEVLPAIRKTGKYAVPKATRPLTTDDYMEAARLIKNCERSRVGLVVGLLEQGGFDIPRTMTIQTTTIPVVVQRYLNTLQHDAVIDLPTCEVYNDFVEWCEFWELTPVSNIMFSKYVNRVFGTSCKCKKINNKVYHVFVEK